METISHKRASKPKNVDIELDFEALNIIYRWWSTRYIFPLVSCIIWDSLLVYWYYMVPRVSTWNTIGIPIIHIIGIIGLTYYTIAGFVNRTMIKVNLHWLIITHGPLPWFGNKRIDRNQVTQLYAEETSNQSSKVSSSFTYQLSTILRDNTKLKLLAGLPSPDVALFVEQSVEEYMHIEDRSVIGELLKPTL